jgi:hypothetical protein
MRTLVKKTNLLLAKLPSLVAAVLIFSFGSIAFANSYTKECKKECRTEGSSCRNRGEIRDFCAYHLPERVIDGAKELYGIRASNCFDAVRQICTIEERECKKSCED